MKITYTRRVIDNKVNFSADYPIGINGLVRLKQCSYSSNSCTLVIDTHKKNFVSIVAVMEKNDADKICKWEKDSIIYVPWCGDTIEDIHNIKYDQVDDNTITTTQNEKIRGGNRLVLELRYKADFYITIPEDADLEANLLDTDIDYKSYRCTKLHVDCKDVNICGDSGSSGPDGQSWSYYAFSKKETDPISHITTKGNVNLPIGEIENSLDRGHFNVWKYLTSH